MSTLTNGSPFEIRVMIESYYADKLMRVNVWMKDNHTFVSFTPHTTEEEATSVVARGLSLIRPLDIKVLFSEQKRPRRLIETD